MPIIPVLLSKSAITMDHVVKINSEAFTMSSSKRIIDHLVFDLEHTTNTTFCQRVAEWFASDTLKLTCNSSEFASALTRVAARPRIRSLCIRGFSNDRCNAFADLVRALPDLANLAIAKAGHGIQAAVMPALPRCTSLTHISIVGRLHDVAIADALASALPQCARLAEFVMSDQNQFHVDHTSIVRALAQCRLLEMITIPCNSDAVTALFTQLPHIRNLRLTDTGAAAWTLALDGPVIAPSLRELYVANTSTFGALLPHIRAPLQVLALYELAAPALLALDAQLQHLQYLQTLRVTCADGDNVFRTTIRLPPSLRELETCVSLLTNFRGTLDRLESLTVYIICCSSRVESEDVFRWVARRPSLRDISFHFFQEDTWHCYSGGMCKMAASNVLIRWVYAGISSAYDVNHAIQKQLDLNNARRQTALALVVASRRSKATFLPLELWRMVIDFI